MEFDEEKENEELDKTRPEGSDPDGTVLEGGGAQGTDGLGLVGRIFQAKETIYRVLKEMEASGAEADVYILQEEGTEEKRVLKYYRRGIRPKSGIMEILAGLNKDHVVQVYETGVKDGRSYEIQEFVEHGSLTDMVTSGGLPEDRIKQILHELLIAVEHLHESNVIHRDLKPANILVRTPDPLDLVFIDFGIASQTEFSLHATSASRTVTYAPPEAMTGVVAKASDWWSVGVILLELLTGEHPFAGLNEQAVNYQLASKGIEVPRGIPGEWQLLIQGLLTRDREKRWGAKQVRKWLEGDRSLTTSDDADHAGERETKKYDYKPYKFAGNEHHEPASLAEALATNWEDGVKHFGRGFVTDWIKDKVENQEMASELMDVAEEDDLSASQKLSVAILVLNPELPLLDASGVLDREGLKAKVSSLRDILTCGLGKWLKKLRGDSWLLELSEEFAILCQKTKAYDEYINQNMVNIYFFCSKEELLQNWIKFRRNFNHNKAFLPDGKFVSMLGTSEMDMILLMSLPIEKITAQLVPNETFNDKSSEGMSQKQDQKSIVHDFWQKVNSPKGIKLNADEIKSVRDRNN